ncbi:unnamed protein product [Prunus armeniaca]|uniref:NYN domain-containing protein n=1 Tax=Prunus armeniaca TaxID=36596 RepID=A0A6J5TVE5_PRUAR|nr:unnamed protein product [Prunus armeniaca]
MKSAPSSSLLFLVPRGCYSCSCVKFVIMAKGNNNKKKSQQPPSPTPMGSEPSPPRITSNVRQNLQLLKLWKEYQKRESSTPKHSTSYRRKKVPKEQLPEDLDLYRDPTTTLYYTNQGWDIAVPVLLVDGYNVCGYWAKLKKHFINGRLDMARQKLIDELVTFSLLREVKVVAVFDAMMSGLPTHKEDFNGVDVVYSGESCADAWIEKEVAALREDGCPKVWVVTSDHIQQHAAHGAGAFIWSCKALVSEVLELGNGFQIAFPCLVSALLGMQLWTHGYGLPILKHHKRSLRGCFRNTEPSVTFTCICSLPWHPKPWPALRNNVMCSKTKFLTISLALKPNSPSLALTTKKSCCALEFVYAITKKWPFAKSTGG